MNQLKSPYRLLDNYNELTQEEITENTKLVNLMGYGEKKITTTKYMNDYTEDWFKQ